MKCIYCTNEAVFRRQYSGESFCPLCFQESIEKQVRRTISLFKMFDPCDHIAVGLSGGKDSVSLLHILNMIEMKFPDSTLSAIMIDEGIAGYREEAMQIAEENCQRLKIRLHIFSFKQLYGLTLDEIAERSMVGRLTVCSYCGILRRKALNLAAKDVHATKLAVAHNLDDEVQSMVLSLLRGDLNGLTKIKPVLGKVRGFVQKVKPLCNVLEREISFYAYIKDLQFQQGACPYLESSMRSEVRRFLNESERRHPGITFSMHRSISKLLNQYNGTVRDEPFNYCQCCGEPSSGTLCRACISLQELGVMT